MKKKIFGLLLILSFASCQLSSFAFSTKEHQNTHEMRTEKNDAFSNNYQATNYTVSGISIIEKIFN